MFRRRVEGTTQRPLEALGHARLVNDPSSAFRASGSLFRGISLLSIGEGCMSSSVDLKEVSGYYQALGKFVDTFANVERFCFYISTRRLE